MATHSSTLTWKSHGQRSLAGYSPWGHKESDTMKWLSMHAWSKGDIQKDVTDWEHLENEYWLVSIVPVAGESRINVSLIIWLISWAFKHILELSISSVQSLSRIRLFATPWIAACQAFLSITNSRSSLRLTSIESVMPSNNLILYHPFLLLPSIIPSVFSNASVLCIRRPKYWSFSFSISLSNGYSGLISFRMNWLDLLAVQGTLKSLL